MADPRLYLASRSPRRRALLDQIGIDYRVVAVAVKELAAAGEGAEDFVCRMALEKATAGWDCVKGLGQSAVLGADTVVMADGAPLGKPRDEAEARNQLSRLSGREHQVLSAVAIVSVAHQAMRLSKSRVWFRQLSPAMIERYCATGEPLDKAGSYAIQGRAALFIRRLEGSYSGVMGLPLFETGELLHAVGLQVLVE
ncbi:MAG: Maf family protein [Gammaproteobacteria bacterium]